ncbi:MAG: AzlC family ABC transporter permease [Ilumatobacter sp.]
MTTPQAPSTRANSRIDRRAVADIIPLALPAIPFGFVIGLASTESAMPLWIAWLTSPLVFAGAAQLTMITLAGSASVWAIITAVLVINTRHVMYSAAMAPAYRNQPRWMRWFGPFLMVDQIFALAITQTEREPADFRRYYLTAAITLFAIWNTAVPIGMVVGPIVPDSWRLDFAPPVMFVGLTLLALNRLPAAVAAMVGGFVSLMTTGLRDRLGIVVGALAGIFAAAVVEQIIEQRATTQQRTDTDATSS